MPTKKGKGLPPYNKTSQTINEGFLDSAHSIASDKKYRGVVPRLNSINTKPSASSGTRGDNQPDMKGSGYRSVGEQRMTTLGRPHISTKPKK